MATTQEINRRLDTILKRLLNSEALSSVELAEQMEVSSKTVSRYLRDRISSSHLYNEIHYDPKIKKWKATNTGKIDRFLNDEERFVMSVLEKYSNKHGDGFDKKAKQFFKKYKQSISNNIYTKVFTEDISKRIEDLLLIERAINELKIVTMNYNGKDREVHPYKIANFDGYWYLVALNTSDNKIKNFYFKNSSKVEITDNTFEFPKNDVLEKIEKGINAYFDFDAKEIEVIILVDSKVADIFSRLKINSSQRVMRVNNDSSLEVSICITHEMEIIPFIQKWLPHIKVIEPPFIRNIIIANISNYQ